MQPHLATEYIIGIDVPTAQLSSPHLREPVFVVFFSFCYASPKKKKMKDVDSNHRHYPLKSISLLSQKIDPLLLVTYSLSCTSKSEFPSKKRSILTKHHTEKTVSSHTGHTRLLMCDQGNSFCQDYPCMSCTGRSFIIGFEAFTF